MFAVAAVWGGGKDLTPQAFNPFRAGKAGRRSMKQFFRGLRQMYDEKRQREAEANGSR